MARVRFLGSCRECGAAVCVAVGGRVRAHHEVRFCSSGCLDAHVGRLEVGEVEAEAARLAFEGRARGLHAFEVR